MGNAKSLIVGALGQVGSQLVRWLDPSSCIRTSRQPKDANFALDLEGLDRIDRIPAALGKLEWSDLYCVGGMNDVDGCESAPEAAMRANCVGPAVLAAEANRRGIPFVYFSTDYVFDGRGGPYSEDAPVNPLGVYGRSKAAGEAAVCSACPHALIIRTTVVYGPDRRAKNFVYSLASALRAGRRMRLANDQLSTPTYNVDLAAASIALVRCGASGVLNVCGPERVSRLNFASECAQLLGLPVELIDGVPTALLGQPASRPLSAGLNSEKLLASTGYHMRGIRDAFEDWIGPGFALRSSSDEARQP
jgi:dTDP-4-dehydrorhamnose reductase